MRGFRSKIHLKENENIILEGKPALTAVLTIWLAVPAVFVAYWIIFYLPYYIRTMFSKTFRTVVMEQLGVSSLSEINPAEYIFADLIDEMSWIYDLVGFFVGLLVFVWFCVCLVVTYRHFNSYLVITDSRVIGITGNDKIDAPLEDMVNCFVEQSIWGRLLNFGSVVVYSKRKSITFKSISDPHTIKDKLMTYV